MTARAMNWKRVPIKEVYHGLFDGPHATPKPSEDGPIFLGIKNVTDDGRLDLSEIRNISEAEFPKWTKRVLPQEGDLVFTYEATLNRYAIIPKGFRGCLGRRMALIRPNPEKVDNRFLFQYFFGADWRNTINKNILSGSTVDRIPLSKFPDFEINLPPLETQRKIASILSAYDDLIENNTRRIKILEEMSRLIYREWFVNFRFPGHEQVKMVDSPLGYIPEGWEVKAFTDLADILSGGTPKTTVAEYWDGSIPFFAPKDAPSQYYVTTTEKAITEVGLKKCNSKLYPKDTVFITARGTVGKVIMPSCDMAMNQSCYALVGKEGVSQQFLFLLTLHCVEYLKKNTGGATFDTIVVDTFKRLEVVRPPNDIIETLTQKIKLIFDQIMNLIRKNQNLRQTRDLLLPKLISGEVAV